MRLNSWKRILWKLAPIKVMSKGGVEGEMFANLEGGRVGVGGAQGCEGILG